VLQILLVLIFELIFKWCLIVGSILQVGWEYKFGGTEQAQKGSYYNNRDVLTVLLVAGASL